MVNKRFSVLLLVVGLFLLSCSEDPNSTGAKLLPKSDFLRIDTLDITAVKSYSISTIPGYSNYSPLLVGKLDDVESWGAIRFFGLPDTLDDTKLLDASVILRANYHYGDSLAPFSLALHRILTEWGLDSLTLDTLQAPGFYNLTPMSQPSLGSVGDTDFVSLPLDTTVVRIWLSAVGDTITTNFGILFRPTNSRVIKGFTPFTASDATHYPKLQIRYTRDGSKIDTVNITSGILRFGAKIANTSWSMDSTLMYVRSGLSYRSGIEFNIASLPKRIAIHNATLELALNSQLSQFNSYTIDSTYVYYVASDGTTTSTNDLSEAKEVGGRRVYEFQIAAFVQQWLLRQSYHSVVIGGANEGGSFDLYRLYGSAASANLKPRLRIIYSSVQ